MSVTKRLLLLALSLVAAFLMWFAWGFTRWGQMRYVAYQTKLEFPIFASNLYVYDDSEMGVVAHISLDAKRVDRLLHDPRFRSLKQNPYPLPFRHTRPAQLRHIGNLPKEFRDFKPNARIYQAGGCAHSTDWAGLLDARSGSLWIQVNYPDWSGDKPGCLMDAVKAVEQLNLVAEPLRR